MPEKELAWCCTVTAFVVETLKPTKCGKDATGTISMYDHIEGCRFENKWQATIGLEDEGHYNITVKPIDSWAGDGFTCNTAINKAANGFIISAACKREPPLFYLVFLDLYNNYIIITAVFIVYILLSFLPACAGRVHKDIFLLLHKYAILM